MNYKLTRFTSIAILTFACSTALAGAATYTVKKGDTLAKIARETGVPLGELLRANKSANPNKISQGMQLNVPGKGTPASTGKTTPKPLNIKEKKQPAPPKKPVPAATAATSRPASAPPRNKEAVNIQAPGKVSTYTVQRGDTLSRIKREQGISIEEIVRLNNLGPNGALQPGQVLRLRSGAESKNTTPKPAVVNALAEPIQESAPPPPAATGRHVVQKGETFSSIARTYGLAYGDLARANRTVDQANLKPGQTLIVPDQSPAVPAPATEEEPKIDGRVFAPRPDPLSTEMAGSKGVRTRTGYRVEDGDTLKGVATRFFTSEDYLRRLNRMSDFENIHAGQYILVPFYKNTKEGAARYGNEG